MNELHVIMRTHELYGQISKITEKLPGLKRQSLGHRLENKTLELLEILVMAKNTPKSMKAAYLIKATAVAEIVGFHLRTMLEQKLANDTTLHQLIAKTDEISRQIGGWQKSVQ